MSNFKVGDKVRIVANVAGSVNEIGDVGVVIEHNDNQTDTYRVKVGDRFELYNWSFESDLELVTENTLQVGKTYTSENGSEWECIFIRDGKAWLAELYSGVSDGAAYLFNIDGTNISQGGGLYNIMWGPKMETVTVPVTYVVHTYGGGDFYRGHQAYIGRERTPLTITFDLIDGTPDWTTAKVTPCD